MSRLPPKSIHTRERLAQPGRVLAGVDDILRRLGGLIGPFKRDTVNDFVISHVFDPSLSSLRRHLGVAVNLGLDGLSRFSQLLAIPWPYRSSLTPPAFQLLLKNI
jgi:hypothetical protein